MGEDEARRSGDGFLSLLGMARKAGKLEMGNEPVSLAAREHRARLILTAEDAAEGIVRKGAGLSGKNCPALVVPYSKARLGTALGQTSCALLAVTDSGFAAALGKKLSATDPGPYAAVTEELERRAEKKLRRRRVNLSAKKK